MAFNILIIYQLYDHCMMRLCTKHSQALSGSVRLFGNENSGAAAVEFAITIIPFLVFIFIIMQAGLFFFSQQSLDYATRMAARQIMTGDVQAKGLTAVQFKNTMICPLLSVPISCSDITVSVTVVSQTSSSTSGTGIYALMQQSVPSLNPVNLDASKGSFCVGNSGDFVFVDVAYNFSRFADLVTLIAGSLAAQNPMVLRSTAFLVNEPFQSSSSAPQTGC